MFRRIDGDRNFPTPISRLKRGYRPMHFLRFLMPVVAMTVAVQCLTAGLNPETGSYFFQRFSA